jgi:uncharacterized protein YukE
MSDLKVDVERLRQCASQLSRVQSEFSHHADPADGYSERELGSSKITGVFNDFGDNWSIHRKKLLEEIQTLGTSLEAAADAYSEVDTKLADALRKVDLAHGGSK